MGKMNKKFATVFMVITLLLTGCGTPQNGNTYIVPQQINDPKISEIAPVYETQVERVNNCDGTNPFYNVSYKTIEAQKASFEVSVGAGGLVTGTPIPSALEVQLEAKITAALAKDYGLTTERNHDLTLDNTQGTFLEHTITWKVTRVKGLIEVIYGDGMAQVGFEKIANVELYDRTSASIGCGGNSTSVISTTLATDNLQQPTAYIVPTVETSPECTPPNGLIPLWYDVPVIWSKGIWGSSNMPNFMSALGEVDSNDSDFGQFQIWIDPCSFNWHGYIDGARFWPHTPNIGKSFPVPIGGAIATTINIPKNTGIWGLGNPSR